MKNKKKLFIIGGSAITIILAVVLCIVLIPKHGEEKPTESEPTESSNTTVVIDEPVSETQSTETNSINESEKIDDDGNGLLKPEVEDDTAEKSETTGEKAKEPNKTVTEQPVSKDEGDTGAIQIGGGESTAYSCGDANHHCENAEYHAYIKNLELAGCPYCGSHNCKSFYATNEWGYTEYTPTKCPEYNKEKDDNEVCPRCGLAYWSADNPTGCFSYLQDTVCECGETVKGNTCHHH